MIKAVNLKKIYRQGKRNNVIALNGVCFEINKGEAVAIVGQSGSGKSTLLNILGGLDTDYSGEIVVGEKDIKKYNTNYYRRHIVGTIFQQFNLIPSLTVAENILAPVKFGKQFDKDYTDKRLKYLLNRLGIENRSTHTPNELSGGQAQRVAIARALITEPDILLADEPTGNLDSKTGEEIVKILFDLNKEENTTLVIVTHAVDLFKGVKKVIYLKDGKLTDKNNV